MIDFRYHLVSLISVFLALAVGIILGAGPLQGPLGDSLTQQVESLRADRDQLREQARAAESINDAQTNFIEQSATRLLSGSMTGTPVVVIALPGVESTALDALEARIGESGATLTTRATLADDFLSRDSSEQVASLQGIDSSLPDGTEGLLQGLALALSTGKAAAGDEAEGDDAEDAADAPDPAALLGVLVDSGLVATSEDAPARAEIAIVLDEDHGTTAWAATPTPEADADQDTSPTTPPVAADPAAVEAFQGLALALEKNAEGTVVAGDGISASDGLVGALREQENAISTVDGVFTPAGQVIAVLAAAEQARGGHGAYGFAVDDLLPPDPEEG